MLYYSCLFPDFYLITKKTILHFEIFIADEDQASTYQFLLGFKNSKMKFFLPKPEQK